MGYARLSSDYYTRWCSARSGGTDGRDRPGDFFVQGGPGVQGGLLDEDLELALLRMQATGFERVVFYDREEPMQPEEFIAWARESEKRLCFIIFKADGTPLSLVWLTGPSMTGRQVFAHFCGFALCSREELLRGGRLFLDVIGKGFGIRQYIGVTPLCYRHALGFACDLGFVRLTLLKQAALCLGKERDAVLSIYVV
jgi:hypothetical protein